MSYDVMSLDPGKVLSKFDTITDSIETIDRHATMLQTKWAELRGEFKDADLPRWFLDAETIIGELVASKLVPLECLDDSTAQIRKFESDMVQGSDMSINI